MAIFRDERKSIWTRKNKHAQGGTVDLVVESDTFLAIRHSQSPNQILLTKDQLYEMAGKAADYFGDELVVTAGAKATCPNCGGFLFGYWQDNKGVQKFCRGCVLSGPVAETRAGADAAWDHIFNPDLRHQGSITVEEELQRR